MQGLPVVGRRIIRGVSVLFEMQPGQIELLAGLDLLRFANGLCRSGNLFADLLMTPAQRFTAILDEADTEILQPLLADCDLLDEHLLGRQRMHTVIEGSATALQHHAHLLLRRSEDLDRRRTLLCLEIQQQVGAGVLDHAQLTVRHEILREGLLLVGLQPSEVRLVVGIDAGHQFDVGSVGVGQVSVPGPSEITAAPGPLLLSGGEVMVGHMEQSGPRVVLVPADEIVFRDYGHVGGRDRNILVT